MKFAVLTATLIGAASLVPVVANAQVAQPATPVNGIARAGAMAAPAAPTTPRNYTAQPSTAPANATAPAAPNSAPGK
jgi:hypothetical protein